MHAISCKTRGQRKRGNSFLVHIPQESELTQLKEELKPEEKPKKPETTPRK